MASECVRLLGGGRWDDRRVFSPPPGLTVSVLTSALALRPKNKIVVVAISFNRC